MFSPITSNLSKIEKYFNAPIDKKRHFFITGNTNSGRNWVYDYIRLNTVLFRDTRPD